MDSSFRGAGEEKLKSCARHEFRENTMKATKLSLILFFTFGTFLMSYSQTQCPYCRGCGKVRCATCNGYGRVSVTQYSPYYGYYTMVVPCTNCSGIGCFYCTHCSGTGVVYNVSFKDSCQSKYGGKKCSNRHEGKVCNCTGFVGQNWDPCTCSNCRHPASEHTK